MEKTKHASDVTELEYENKFLRDSLKVSTIIVSILTSILTTIIIVNILE